MSSSSSSDLASPEPDSNASAVRAAVGSATDVPPCDATETIQCDLCGELAWEYAHFFVESQYAGFRWGRRCPRERCPYRMCYVCVLRLPTASGEENGEGFLCPACRFPWAKEAGIPQDIIEWRTAADREQEEFQEMYDVLYAEHVDLLRIVSEDTEGMGAADSAQRAITQALGVAMENFRNSIEDGVLSGDSGDESGGESAEEEILFTVVAEDGTETTASTNETLAVLTNLASIQLLRNAHASMQESDDDEDEDYIPVPPADE